jgi:hypothetical protein
VLLQHSGYYVPKRQDAVSLPVLSAALERTLISLKSVQLQHLCGKLSELLK